MWPTTGELEMPDLPWFNAEEEIQKLREIGVSEWVCHVNPVHSHLLPWLGGKDLLQEPNTVEELCGQFCKLEYQEKCCH